MPFSSISQKIFNKFNGLKKFVEFRQSWHDLCNIGIALRKKVFANKLGFLGNRASLVQSDSGVPVILCMPRPGNVGHNGMWSRGGSGRGATPLGSIPGCHRSVAQRVEQRTINASVAGSIPAERWLLKASLLGSEERKKCRMWGPKPPPAAVARAKDLRHPMPVC